MSNTVVVWCDQVWSDGIPELTVGSIHCNVRKRQCPHHRRRISIGVTQQIIRHVRHICTVRYRYQGVVGGCASELVEQDRLGDRSETVVIGGRADGLNTVHGAHAVVIFCEGRREERKK